MMRSQDLPSVFPSCTRDIPGKVFVLEHMCGEESHVEHVDGVGARCQMWSPWLPPVDLLVVSPQIGSNFRSKCVSQRLGDGVVILVPRKKGSRWESFVLFWQFV